MATKLEPIVPPAPGRFSTTMLWPSCGARYSNTARGMMSVVLPAPTGTITRSGFVGQVSAPAFMAASTRATAGKSIRRTVFHGRLLASSVARHRSSRQLRLGSRPLPILCFTDRSCRNGIDFPDEAAAPEDVRHRRRGGDGLEGGAAPAHRAARAVPPDQRFRGRARTSAVRSRAPAAGADRRRRAPARRLPRHPGRDGGARRSSPDAEPRRCRRAQGGSHHARRRLRDVPASLCRALSQRADQAERHRRPRRSLCAAGKR